MADSFEIAVARKLRARFGSLHDAFLSLDEDGDGVLSRRDFRRSTARLWDVSLTDAQTDVVFRRFGGHGDTVRYGAFAEYLYNTAHDVSRTTAQDQQRSVRELHETTMCDALPRLDAVTPPTQALPQEILEALRRKIRSRSHTAMTETHLFLDMDTDRSGRVSLQEFRSWTERMGLVLTKEQCASVLQLDDRQDDHDNNGLDLHHFSRIIADVRQHPPGGTPMPWEEPDPDDVKRRRRAAQAAAHTVNHALSTALTLCTDDGTTNRELVESMAEKVLSGHSSSLLQEFHRLDTDKSGKIDATELHAVLTDVLGMDVSKERAVEFMKSCDRDGDGKMSKSDFVFLISNNSIPASGAGRNSSSSSTNSSTAARAHDTDNHDTGDGSTDLTDRDKAAVLEFRQELSSQSIPTRSFYQNMDKSRSQFITAVQLKGGFDKLLVRVTQDQVNRIVHKFGDKDRPGTVKYFQFIKFMSGELG